MGETEACIDKLAPRRNQQRTSEIVSEQAEPQQNKRVAAHQATHAGAITPGPRPGHRAAQHVAPRVMDMITRGRNGPASPVASSRKMKSVSSPRLSFGSKRTLRLRAKSEIKRLEQNVVRNAFSGLMSQAS